MPSNAKGLVILDRDGVINRDSDDFIKSPDEWTALPGSLDAIAAMCAAGFRIAVATNQSGIGRGLYTVDTLTTIHEKMLNAVTAAGGEIAGVFFCPHLPDAGCDCRKPKPGLLRQIAAAMNCELTGVPFIGDSLRDLDAAAEVGARPILVRTGYGRATEQQLAEHQDVPVFDDLTGAAAAIIRQEL